jgi:hypothetical protein
MTRTEITLLRWAGWPVRAAIGVWLLGFAGIWAGWWRPHWYWVLYFLGTAALTALANQWTRAVRERFIREAPLPRFLQRKVRQTYPQLSSRDYELVERGMRQFFLACMRSKKQFVAMPSQAVDALWHEFILHTQAYKRWCSLGLGHFLHHTPAEALGRKGVHNDGLRRAWFWACKEESINPKAPSRLPLLFALDAKLAIPNGFHYVPDCRLIGPQPSSDAGTSSPYCGTDFANSGYSGSAGDFGGSDSSASDGSSSDGGGSDGGGDGGGCGGGCGGGGD